MELWIYITFPFFWTIANTINLFHTFLRNLSDRHHFVSQNQFSSFYLELYRRVTAIEAVSRNSWLIHGIGILKYRSTGRHLYMCGKNKNVGNRTPVERKRARERCMCEKFNKGRTLQSNKGVVKETDRKRGSYTCCHLIRKIWKGAIGWFHLFHIIWPIIKQSIELRVYFTFTVQISTASSRWSMMTLFFETVYREQRHFRPLSVFKVNE